MTARGVEVGREAIRCGTIKSGPQIACNMKRAQPAGAQVPRAHLLWPLGQTPLPGAHAVAPGGLPTLRRRRALLRVSPDRRTSAAS